jgi:hypothetical protein
MLGRLFRRPVPFPSENPLDLAWTIRSLAFEDSTSFLGFHMLGFTDVLVNKYNKIVGLGPI